MKDSLIRFALWLLARYAPNRHYVIPKEVGAMIDPAIDLASALKGWDASGEAKRHTVLAQLLKQFPLASKRDVAKAIEFAIDKL